MIVVQGASSPVSISFMIHSDIDSIRHHLPTGHEARCHDGNNKGALAYHSLHNEQSTSGGLQRKTPQDSVVSVPRFGFPGNQQSRSEDSRWWSRYRRQFHSFAFLF